MEARMNGRFAFSTAGRDVGKIYIIVGNSERCLLLADGVKYTLANPKMKNAKHLELPLQEENACLARMIAERQRGCDETIRQTIHHLIKDNLRYKK